MNLDQLKAQLEATMLSADPAVRPSDRAKAREQYVELFGDEIRSEAREAQAGRAVDTLEREDFDPELDWTICALMTVLVETPHERGWRQEHPDLAYTWRDAWPPESPSEREDPAVSPPGVQPAAPFTEFRARYPQTAKSFTGLVHEWAAELVRAELEEVQARAEKLATRWLRDGGWAARDDEPAEEWMPPAPEWMPTAPRQARALPAASTSTEPGPPDDPEPGRPAEEESGPVSPGQPPAALADWMRRNP